MCVCVRSPVAFLKCEMECHRMRKFTEFIFNPVHTAHSIMNEGRSKNAFKINDDDENEEEEAMSVKCM